MEYICGAYFQSRSSMGVNMSVIPGFSHMMSFQGSTQLEQTQALQYLEAFYSNKYSIIAVVGNLYSLSYKKLITKHFKFSQSNLQNLMAVRT